jgi:hypothetical protein
MSIATGISNSIGFELSSGVGNMGLSVQAL